MTAWQFRTEYSIDSVDIEVFLVNIDSVISEADFVSEIVGINRIRNF